MIAKAVSSTINSPTFILDSTCQIQAGQSLSMSGNIIYIEGSILSSSKVTSDIIGAGQYFSSIVILATTSFTLN